MDLAGFAWRVGAGHQGTGKYGEEQAVDLSRRPGSCEHAPLKLLAPHKRSSPAFDDFAVEGDQVRFDLGEGRRSS
jgi:hypothetical protein